MAAKKETLSNALLDHVLINSAYSAPASVFAACFTTAPTATTSGTEVSDAGTAYARQAVTFGSAASASSSNTGAVTFPAATAPWGTVDSAGICAAGTVGVDDVLYFGNLSSSKVVGVGDQLQFAIGALVVSES